MVKNKKGGSGHKRMARKNVSGGGGYQNKLRKKKEDAEIYARVIKLNGGQFAHIKCEDGKTRNLVIRAKFRRRKRGNRLSAETLVLAGLRDWEVISAKKMPKADLLEVYNGGEAKELQKSGELPECLYEINTGEEEVDDNIEFDRHATNKDFVGQNIIIKSATNDEKIEKRGADKELDEGEINWDDI